MAISSPKHKRIGGVLNPYCFTKAQNSGTVPCCDWWSLRGFRKSGSVQRGCRPLTINASSPHKVTSSRRSTLSSNPHVCDLELPAFEYSGHSAVIFNHKPTPTTTLADSILSLLTSPQKERVIYHFVTQRNSAHTFSIQTVDSALGLPLLSKDLDKTRKSLLAKSSINLHNTALSTSLCVRVNGNVSFFQKPQKGKLYKTQKACW